LSVVEGGLLGFINAGKRVMVSHFIVLDAEMRVGFGSVVE